MRDKRRLLVLSLPFLVLAFARGAGAQEQLRVLRVAAFGGDGLEQGEDAALRDLVTSYVIELKMFRVIDESGQELSLKEEETAVQLGVTKDLTPLTADYILSAETNRVGTLLVFTMNVTKVASSEKKSVAEPFSSVNDLILASRRLTRSLFEKPQDGSVSSPAGATTISAPAASATATSAQVRPPANPAPSLGLVAGTWKGDKNVDRVSILPDGRGFAVLASGARMALKAMIEGGTVIILQDQPNSPDFYRPGLDLKSARIVSAAARPWRWVFSLSTDGDSLNGVKESVFVNVNDKGAVSLDNNYVRDAAWTRLYR
jgi:hypothetical protein